MTEESLEDQALGDAYQQLETISVPIREDVITAKASELNLDLAVPEMGLAMRLWVDTKVNKDDSLKKYHDPSAEELQTILKDVAGYSGDWYHSVVTLVKTEGQWSAEEKAVIDASPAGGVYLYYEFDLENLDAEDFLKEVLN